MKILITGAGGLVGGATIEHCLSLGDNVVAAKREDLDIADRESVFAFLQREKPDSIINCAAMTDVDGCESNEEKNYAANAYGVENLALACRAAGANLVTISTDYVFDGAHNGFYTQRDDPNPISAYGKAKLAGERLAVSSLARSMVVRTGWIFGKNGRNFLSRVPELLLIEGKSIKAVSDAFGTPTYAPDLAARLRELAEADLPGVYHVTNSGDGTTHADSARSVPGVNREQIENVPGSALSRPAPRPLNSKLRCLISDKLGFPPLRQWEQALQHYVESEIKKRD